MGQRRCRFYLSVVPVVPVTIICELSLCCGILGPRLLLNLYTEPLEPYESCY